MEREVPLMGSEQGSTLNQGAVTLTETSAEHGDDGSGNVKWFHNHAVDDGANVALGATTDAAITNPSTDGTLIGYTRGVLTHLATVITSLASILTKLTAGAASMVKLEDDAHASGDAGVPALAVRRDTAAVGSGADGDYSTVNVDSAGRLRTLAKRDPTDALSLVHMAAAAASQVVKGSAGTLHSIVGSIASGEDGYIQVHDATSAPGGGAVPELSVFVGAATEPQPVNIPLPGHVCATGITLAWSTTLATHTAGAAKMMVAAYYE
jgi:hypothetical protein